MFSHAGLSQFVRFGAILSSGRVRRPPGGVTAEIRRRLAGAMSPSAPAQKLEKNLTSGPILTVLFFRICLTIVSRIENKFFAHKPLISHETTKQKACREFGDEKVP